MEMTTGCILMKLADHFMSLGEITEISMYKEDYACLTLTGKEGRKYKFSISVEEAKEND